MRSIRMAIAVPLALIAGCGSAGSTASHPTASSSTGPSATTPAASFHPSGVGLGATTDAWNRVHTADPAQPVGAAYDRDPTLNRPGDNGLTAARYNGLNYNGGRVTDYIERFKIGTTLATARSAARAELPADATTVWSTVVDGCAVDVLHSNLIANSFASAINDKTGLVLIEYFTLGGRLDPADVERAALGPGRDDPTRKSFTVC